ncbi:MAG TPA: hypothetical protein VHY91_05480 [Pirellulales bacterium]|jgi:hypothetical protein|nr:hypothetical protein [Pirellulales bacterium]
MPRTHQAAASQLAAPPPPLWRSGHPRIMKNAASLLSQENPARVFALGDVVEIETALTRNQRFIVDQIQVWSAGPVHLMLDYVLMSVPRTVPQCPARLRLMPSHSSKSKATHRVVMLTLYDSLAHTEDMNDLVRDTAKNFVIIEDADPTKVVHDEFWRVNDLDDPHVCEVTPVASAGDKGSPKSTKFQFWDFSRLLDVDGVETEEFVFVEMSTDSGWFQIWRGVEVTSSQIDVL